MERQGNYIAIASFECVAIVMHMATLFYCIINKNCTNYTGVEEAVSHWSGKFFKHGHTCVESRVTYRI